MKLGFHASRPLNGMQKINRNDRWIENEFSHSWIEFENVCILLSGKSCSGRSSKSASENGLCRLSFIETKEEVLGRCVWLVLFAMMNDRGRSHQACGEFVLFLCKGKR